MEITNFIYKLMMNIRLLTTTFLTITLVLVTWMVSAQPRAWYVSPSGNNDYPGTLQMPFLSIRQAAGRMQAGDTCIIRQGIYREKIHPANNGMAGAPLLFMPYQKDTVVITGTSRITQWVPYKGNIYKAYMPDSVFQLFVNEREAPLASYPDMDSTAPFSTGHWSDVEADSSGAVRFKGESFPENYWQGAYCRILTGHKWIAHIGVVTGGKGNTVFCGKRSAAFDASNPSVYLGEGKGCITGHLHALDHPNEWFWQHDTLYYYPPADIRSLQVEARTAMDGFDGESRAYVSLEGLHFFGASINWRNARHCSCTNGSVRYPTPFHYYNTGWGRQKDYKADSMATEEWPGKGIYITGSDNTLSGMYIAHSWGDGVSLGGVDNTVVNCLIEDCDYSMTDCAAISATGHNLQIRQNTCRKAARSILVHRFADKIGILENDLYDAGLSCDDLGLTYSFYTNGDSSTIAYNWVHDNHAKGTATGIYLDNQDTGYFVHHNVVWNCVYGIQTNKDAVRHRIYNNTVFFCDHAMWAWGPEGTSIIDQSVSDNLSDKPFDQGTVFANNILADAGFFIDAGHHDFRLAKKAAAIKAGAYAYRGKAWVAGSSVRPVTDIFPRN